MSIKPVSDIVLDVAKAADPIKSLAVTEKLARLQASDEALDSGFSNVLGAAAGSVETKAAQTDLLSQMSHIGAGSFRTLAPVDARTKAYKGLEQLVLQSLVETMLPKDAGDVFGHGSAGDIWRSMLADQLAAQIGKSIDLGLFRAGPSGSSLVAVGAQPSQGARSHRSGASFPERQS
ncbi:rod-binding protein [Methylocapsa polymorpha]|uniref:Rod-binding protein n=1 Tax=Methylocapsa polymorpha TaxID=3080828 RepID=A0ABZ0HPX4_9HYPH|nr:rod-binding protein [Methylocapsa sp. RX1]